jgi:trans-aconitate methyltransferase
MLSKLTRLPIRAFRHVLLDRSYESYYSSEVWERKYRDEHYDLGDPQEDGRFGALMQVLRRYDDGPMLDLGCGDGLLWKRYRPLSGSLLVGVDYSDTAVAKANSLALPETEFRCGDYRNFDPGRKFAVVVFNESLYYIDAFPDAVSKAESFLSENGVIVVSMFDTLVTRRIWKSLMERRKWLQSLSVQDHRSKRVWTIRVFPRRDTKQP